MQDRTTTVGRPNQDRDIPDRNTTPDRRFSCGISTDFFRTAITSDDHNNYYCHHICVNFNVPSHSVHVAVFLLSKSISRLRRESSAS